MKRIGKVTYELDFPSELALVYPVFHDSMLKKCIGDPLSIIPLKGLGFDESLLFEKVLIIDTRHASQDIWKLRNRFCDGFMEKSFS